MILSPKMRVVPLEEYPNPETNSKWKHLKNGWLEMLEDDPFRFLLGFGPFAGAMSVSFREGNTQKIKK